MLFFLSLATNIAIADNYLDKNLEHGWFWESSPVIEICPDSRITTNQIIETIDYWFERGVNVDIKEIKKVEYCDLGKTNVIQIMGDRDIRSDEYARTNIKWYYRGFKNENTVYFIKSSKVQLPNNILENDIIVKHEFGHALGLDHTNDVIMKSNH
jgi:hypothetical protein